MGRMTTNLAKAADNAERLAAALAGIPQGGSFSGPGGGGAGGGGGASPNVVFNTTVLSDPSRGRTIRTGDGSGSGGRDIQSRAFAYFGLSSANASAAFIAQIVKAFEDMLAKGALSVRTMGGA